MIRKLFAAMSIIVLISTLSVGCKKGEDLVLPQQGQYNSMAGALGAPPAPQGQRIDCDLIFPGPDNR